MSSQTTDAYNGTDNLEVMKEAVRYNQFLIDLVESQARPGDLVLDFGAGAGTFALPMRERGHRVVCVEPDRGLRDRLQALGLAVHPDIAELPDGSVDYIYTLNVLEHIEDDAAALRQLHDKLRPGGRLLVYVPAFDLLFSGMDRKVGHYRRYRRGPLAATLRQAGFILDRSEYVDSLGFAATLLYKAMGDRGGDINVGLLKLYDSAVFPVSRALDRLLSRLAGKNLLLLARRG